MSDQRQSGSEYRCSQCNQTFGSSEELRRHNETQHKEKSQGAGAGHGSGQSPQGGSGSNR
jgi:hypothetical protein